MPDLEPLRVRDLIRIDGSDADELCSFVARVAGAVLPSACGVVVNTSEGIEAPELAALRRELSRPAFAVGPLHLLSRAPAAAEQTLRAADRGCLAWLDARPPRSVLYVSLGSVAAVGRAAFEETAWGLAGSGVPFLWVVRPGSVGGGAAADGDEAPPLPDGFEEEARDRGKVATRMRKRARHLQMQASAGASSAMDSLLMQAVWYGACFRVAISLHSS